MSMFYRAAEGLRSLLRRGGSPTQKNREAVVKLAQSVVSARLAAGAQIVGPVGFWRQGEFDSGEECQLVLRPGSVPAPRPLRAVRDET